MANITFNANEGVFLKLTDKGRSILKERDDAFHARFPNFPRTEEKIDSEGYVRMQLWHAMQVFGAHMGLGTEPPFSMDIILATPGG